MIYVEYKYIVFFGSEFLFKQLYSTAQVEKKLQNNKDSI